MFYFNQILVVISSLGISLASSAFSSVHNNKCYSKHIATSSLNQNALTQFLNCLGTNQSLSLVAAQWLVLTKAHWSIVHSNRLGNGEYDFAIKGIDNSLNPMNPEQKHELELNLSLYRTDPSSVENLVQELEQTIFPAILRGEGSSHPHQNRTSWSVDASFHHYLAYHDTPLPKSRRYRGEGAKSGYYKGTLLESAGWNGHWYQKYFNGLKDRKGRRQTTAFSVLKTSFLGTKFWPQLRQLYGKMREDTSTRCLFRQERKAVQALFTLLDHPHLVRAVHFTRLPGFGPQQDDYDFYVRVRPKQTPDVQKQIDFFLQGNIWGKSESLPRTIGSLGLPGKAVATGDLDFDFSFTGGGGSSDYASHINYANYGSHGLIGRPLYIEAINKSIRNNNGSASFFQGQNAIVREISPSAVRSLQAMGGLGNANSRKIRQTDGYMVRPENRPRIHGDASNSKIEKRSGEVRQIIAEANRLIDSLFPRGSASYLYADYSRNPSGSHPVRTNPYFKETIVSFGQSLEWWAKFLQRKQPGLRYYLIGYDYGMRQRESKRPHFKSYYDRLLEILDPQKGRHLFNEFEL